VFSTDNGTEVFTWPDGGQTPFAQSKGTVMEGGFRAPAMIRWPGRVPVGKVENGIISGLDWFPTFVAAAGNPNIAEVLKKGKLWHRLLGRPVSKYGRLCQGDGAHGRGDRAARGASVGYPPDVPRPGPHAVR
jgi:arylsulfatase A-like enzyme